MNAGQKIGFTLTVWNSGTGDAKGVDVLDGDSAMILDRAVPLSLLRQASTSTLLPEATRG